MKKEPVLITREARVAAQKLCVGSKEAFKFFVGPAVVFISKERPMIDHEKIETGLRLYARQVARVTLPDPIPDGYWETPVGRENLATISRAMFRNCKKN